MAFVCLGLGSNRAWHGMDSLALLRAAVRSLSELLSDMQASSVYVTKPMYLEEQADFYNMAVCGSVGTDVTPRVLLERIHEIEASLGRDREREVRNGPRSIDIDIELFGNERVQESDLEIPHPRLMERSFVLVPLCEALEKAGEAACALGSDMLSALRDARTSIPLDGIRSL